MSQLPKEMRDAIDDIMERKFYFKNMPEHRDRIENSLNEISEAAALHYSQIIEEKDKQYANLKQCARDYAEQGRREMERVDKLLKEIEGLKAENEALRDDKQNIETLNEIMVNQADEISRLQSQIKEEREYLFEHQKQYRLEVEKLQSQIKGLVQGLNAVINKMFSRAVQHNKIKEGRRIAEDTLTNYYNSTKQPSDNGSKDTTK